MVGGEESVSAVQHACSTAGPTGQQHRCHRADTAASARHREPGVADVKKKTKQVQSRSHTPTVTVIHSPAQVQSRDT